MSRLVLFTYAYRDFDSWLLDLWLWSLDLKLAKVSTSKLAEIDIVNLKFVEQYISTELFANSALYPVELISLARFPTGSAQM